MSLNALPLPTLLPGDATLDGVVDLSDFGRLKAQLGKGGFWYQGNFNEDARVDLADFGVLKANFGRSVGTAIPEPPPWLLAALAAICCVGLRRSGRGKIRMKW